MRAAYAAALAGGLGIAYLDFTLADAGVEAVLLAALAFLLTLPVPRGSGWGIAVALGVPATLLGLAGHADPGALRWIVLAFAGSYAAVGLRATLVERPA